MIPADGFAFSAEFQLRYGTLTNQQFVEQLYHNVFIAMAMQRG